MVRYIVENDDETIQEPASTAYLILLVEGRQSQIFPLRGLVYLGRDKSNSVVVADKKVSRHHATLTPLEETFILTDQGSANGTYLNGVLISQPTRLKHRDRIGIGDTVFLFSTSMPEENLTIGIDELGATVNRRPQSGSTPLALAPVRPTAVPLWVLLGCMGVVIILLLLVLVALLGLLVGQNHFSAAVMANLISMTGILQNFL